MAMEEKKKVEDQQKYFNDKGNFLLKSSFKIKPNKLSRKGSKDLRKSFLKNGIRNSLKSLKMGSSASKMNSWQRSSESIVVEEEKSEKSSKFNKKMFRSGTTFIEKSKIQKIKVKLFLNDY